MEDKDIINLYLERNEEAINETDKKYGGYCKTIARNILNNNEDAEECVNDTYLRTWNSIPPTIPNILSVYLGKITRNLSLDRLRYNKADKRGSGEINLVIDELSEILPGELGVEDEIEKKELLKFINEFLDTLSKDKCNIFICRYWYGYSISEIASKFGYSDRNVATILNRVRNKLKVYLRECGYIL